METDIGSALKGMKEGFGIQITHCLGCPGSETGVCSPGDCTEGGI